MVPLVFFAASCFIGGEKIHIQKRQEATLTSLPTHVYIWSDHGTAPHLLLLLLLLQVSSFN